MIAQVIALLVPIIRLFEVLLSYGNDRGKRANEANAVLLLREYRHRLEKAHLARRESHSETLQITDVDGPGGRASGLPDDGYRRD